MGSPSGRPTLADVARAAGVSASAASLVLRGRPGTGERTRRRVLAAARAVGYRAPRPALPDSGLLGVIATDLANAYHTDVIAGIERYAEAEGTGVVIAQGRRDPDQLERQLTRMLGLGVDGVVVASTWLGPAALAAAAAVVPVAVIGRLQEPVPGVDTVHCDDETGAALAVRHLVEHGHRHLVHVTASSRPGPAARRAGFAAEAARWGLADRIEVIGPADGPRLDEQLRDLLRRVAAGRSPAPTAVFAANDVAAVRVLHRAAEAGVPVPDRLSVVGYDSSHLALTVRPHLTSVHQPREEMGRLAAQMIRERLGGRVRDAALRVAPVLRERDSTAAAPRPAV